MESFRLFNVTIFDCAEVHGGAGGGRASATDFGGPQLGSKSAIVNGIGWGNSCRNFVDLSTRNSCYRLNGSF